MITDFLWSVSGNMATYRMYLNKLINIGISAYEWRGLPLGVDAVFMEKMLFHQGKVVFFKDPVGAYAALSFFGRGKHTIYGYPAELEAYSPYTNYRATYNSRNSVVIYNNVTRTPSYLPCKVYAMDLYDLHMTARVNAKAQKTPVLILASKKHRLTMKNLYKNYDGNSPVIYGDDDLNLAGVKVLKTDAPYVVDKIQVQKEKIWNEALNMLGVANIEGKKERYIESEIEARTSGSNAQIGAGLMMRQQAAEKINKIFGLHVSVGPRYEGGGGNGEVHNVGEDDMRTASGVERGSGSEPN